jgi:large subunit ribosomal protein L9
MKVVFMEEVEGTARVGEIRNVADGFARNYLLPRRLAAPATEHYIAIAQARAEKEARRQARLDEEARTYLLPKMEGAAVTIEVRVGEQGKMFGSVTARDIAGALQEATGVELEHRQVDLRQPIRELGSQEVTVKLTHSVHLQVVVNVEPLGGVPEAEAEAAEAAEGAPLEEPAAIAEAEAAEAVEEAPAEEEFAAAEAEPEAETAEAEAVVEEAPAEEEAVAAEVEAEAEAAEAEPEAETAQMEAVLEEAPAEEEPTGEEESAEQRASEEPAAEEVEAEEGEEEEQ